jgi:hypothetical protein
VTIAQHGSRPENAPADSPLLCRPIFNKANTAVFKINEAVSVINTKTMTASSVQ